MKKYVEDIIKTLKQVIRESVNDKVALSFSAGLDSSILAKILRDLGLNHKLYSIVTRYSKDEEYIFKIKPYFSNVEIIRLSETDIIRTYRFLIKRIPRKTRMDLSIATCFYFVAREASKDECKILMTAQGADELFGGYYRYLRLSKNPKRLKEEMEKDFIKCLNIDYLRDKNVSDIFGLKYFAPFSTKEMHEVAKKIPMEYKIKNNIRKFILREVAKTLNLPSFIYNREKKALQYSTGIEKIVKKLKLL